MLLIIYPEPGTGAPPLLPGYGHPLFLSSGQFEAPLPHLGLVAARPLHDGAVQLSQTGRRPHLLLLALQPPVLDVVQDAVVEQHAVLGHDGYLPPGK